VIDVGRRALLPYEINLAPHEAIDAAFTGDGRSVLTAENRHVELWDVRTGRARSTSALYEAQHPIVWVTGDPSGRLGALSVEEGPVEVIDLLTGELVATLNGSVRGVPAVFSSDGHWLATEGSIRRILVWDTQSWRVHGVWEGVFGFDSLVFTPDSRFLVSRGEDVASVSNAAEDASA
jgi:WD40 repeat protein